MRLLASLTLNTVLSPHAAMCAAACARSRPCQPRLGVQRVREKDKDREKDRQRDMERERARYVKADLEGHDSDDEREPWQRRSLRHS